MRLLPLLLQALPASRAMAAHDASIAFSSCSDALRSGFSCTTADAGTAGAHKPCLLAMV